MSEPASAAVDAERLDDARFVLGEGSAALRQSAYAIYVTVMLGLTYGLTVARAAFATGDPQWLRDQILSWPALLVLVLGVTVGTVLAHRTGRARGPVVPPLPWIDVVAAGPIDRALSLRRWWVLALTGAVTGGVLVGGIFGGGLWAARVGGPLWLVGFLAGGLVVALVLVTAWLAGQASLAPALPGARTLSARDALRRLALDDLRQQAARSTRLGGAMLVGDLRSVRLEVAAPVTRGRSLRLRSTHPVVVIARRDLLGLRRMPSGFATGAALTVAGMAGVGWLLANPQVPPVLALVAVIGCYLGFGAWAEGLRLQGDNVGTPPLIGLDARHEATGHLVVPVVLFVVVGGLTSGAVAWASSTGVGHRDLLALLWAVPLTVVLAGAHLLAAFRGMAPAGIFGGRSPMLVAGWYLLPLLAAVAVGGGATAFATRGASTPWVLAAGLGWVLVTTGLGRARSQSEAHRV